MTTVNGTMDNDGVDRDSDNDNGVIIHEYGHGISNRLTGGPNNTGLPLQPRSRWVRAGATGYAPRDDGCRDRHRSDGAWYR